MIVVGAVVPAAQRIHRRLALMGAGFTPPTATATRDGYFRASLSLLQGCGSESRQLRAVEVFDGHVQALLHNRFNLLLHRGRRPDRPPGREPRAAGKIVSYGSSGRNARAIRDIEPLSVRIEGNHLNVAVVAAGGSAQPFSNTRIAQINEHTSEWSLVRRGAGNGSPAGMAEDLFPVLPVTPLKAASQPGAPQNGEHPPTTPAGADVIRCALDRRRYQGRRRQHRSPLSGARQRRKGQNGHRNSKKHGGYHIHSEVPAKGFFNAMRHSRLARLEVPPTKTPASKFVDASRNSCHIKA